MLLDHRRLVCELFHLKYSVQQAEKYWEVLYTDLFVVVLKRTIGLVKTN